MGIYACYKEIDGEKIEEMLCEANKKSEENEIAVVLEKSEKCSLDKLWDGLHCLLTGVSATHLLKGNLLSEAVMGRELWPHESDISFVFPERTAEIAAALNEFNLEEALNTFSPEHFYEEDVYPNIWLRDDKEDLKQELQMAFEVLKNFYNTMAKKQKGVMVIIG